MKCQVVFRTRRGGTGLDYVTVRAEFMAVFGQYIEEVLRELPARYRVWVALDLPPHRIPELGELLGYTQGILVVHEEPYRGQTQDRQERGRWWQGWFRRDGRWIFQDELYVQDEELWRSESPHLRPLQVWHQGEVVERVGHRAQRGLSALDARFLLNITPLASGARVLDPFAGFGGIVQEGQRRGMQMFATDCEPQLLPGLSQRCRGCYVIADARAIPFTSDFDAIITEPPFRTSYREAVLSSLGELHRLVHNGPLTFLVAEDMVEQMSERLIYLGRKLMGSHLIRRNRGLRCMALCFR